MKKLVSMILAVAMLLGLVSAALAEPAEASETAAMPEIGGVVEGFELVETRDYPLMDAVIFTG